MAKTRTTLTIDEDVLRAVRVRAARMGRGDSEVIEDALRQQFGIGLLENLWQGFGDLTEVEAMELALEVSREVRSEMGRGE